MAILPIITVPDKRLRKISEPVSQVTDELRQLAEDMLDTMYDAPGVGLAAPQVGVSLRVAVTDVDWRSEDGEKNHQVWINPEFTWKSDETEINEEGCLSLPEIYGDVERPNAVRLKWYDLDGKKHEQDFDGFQAVALQHEFDHLDGKVFIDYFTPLKRRMITKKLKKKYLS
ncbi:MAG: peptide deformylase [Ghiorsea sp.]|nr:peptide deformylase [Ghiorsea sp.]